MSIRVMTTVWEHSKAEGTQLLLLLAIADYADDDGVATAKIQQLAHKCRQSPRATSYQIATLQQIGELKVSTTRGRGNRNTFTVTIGENMQKLHVLNPVKHAIQRKKNMQSSVGIYIPSCNTHDMTHTARARARHVSGEKSSSFPVPSTLAKFTEEYLDDELNAWLEEHCPLVHSQQSTANFIEYHLAEKTQFTSRSHLLKLWRGWVRGDQAKAAERAEARAARKESGNGANRKPRQAAESRNMQNLRATVEQFGLPDDDAEQVKGAEGVRAYARKVAAAKRAARPRSE